MKNVWHDICETMLGYPDDTGMPGHGTIPNNRVQRKQAKYPYDGTPGVDMNEIEGSPILLKRSSPGGMAGVVPGGPKFGNDPFDHSNVSDDELERAADPSREYFAGSKLPSDIQIVATDRPFSQGLGVSQRKRADPFGVQDARDNSVRDKGDVWSFLESIVCEASIDWGKFDRPKKSQPKAMKYDPDKMGGTDYSKGWKKIDKDPQPREKPLSWQEFYNKDKDLFTKFKLHMEDPNSKLDADDRFIILYVFYGVNDDLSEPIEAVNKRTGEIVLYDKNNGEFS